MRSVKYAVLALFVFCSGCGLAIVDQEQDTAKTFGLSGEDLSYIIDQAPQQ